MNPSRERLILLTGVVAAIVARMFFINVESGDYVKYLDPWYQFIQAHGVFHAFRFRFTKLFAPLPASAVDHDAACDQGHLHHKDLVRPV